jgi:hypothetical protein
VDECKLFSADHVSDADNGDKNGIFQSANKSPSVCTCKLKHSQCADCIDMESSSDCLFSVKISLTYNVRWFYSPTVI